MNEIFFFKNKRGEDIACFLHKPDKYNGNFVILCHGFGSSKNGSQGKLVEVARRLCDKGFQVLRFDFPCNGDSDGNFVNNDFSDWTETLIELSKKFKYEKLGLLGNSIGGACVIHSLAKGIKADYFVTWVAGIAFPDKSTNAFNYVLNGVKVSEERGLLVNHSFWDDIFKINFENELKNIKIHGKLFFVDNDKYVPFDKIKKMIKDLPKNFDVEIFKGIDHGFSNYKISQELITKTVKFIEEK